MQLEKPDTQLYQGFEGSTKGKAYDWLTKHLHEKQRGKIKRLAEFLGLDYKKDREYLWQISSTFKTDIRNRQGLKAPNWHNWLGRIAVLEGLSREAALAAGWVQTRAKNHYLLWRDPRGLGRCEWFLNGTVKVWVRKPVSDARKLQLLADAFFNTFLVTDVKVFSEWAKCLRQVGVHCAVDVGFDVPYFKIDLFQDSNGFVVVGGDKSHRNCVEFKLQVPEWAQEYREKADLALQTSLRAVEEFTKRFQDTAISRPLPKDKSVV
jgi:hypothetical protein